MFWIDWVIIGFIVFGIWQGFFRGFISQAFQIGSLIAATAVTFWAFPRFGEFLEMQLRLPITYARPISLLIIFFVTAFILHIVATFLQKLFAPMLTASLPNRAGGAALGAAQKIIIASFVLALLVTLPTPKVIKDNVDGSKLARPLVRLALAVERKVGGALSDETINSLSYHLVGSEQKTTTSLNYHIDNPQVDTESEIKMYAITNAVRQENKKALLIPNTALQEVARNHAKDMLQRGYFSHYAPPNSKDALGRVQDAKIVVAAVGENLANAPTIEIAQAGLMASPGHRANILSEDFNQIGIGVFDAGSHGKMVVQVFAKIY